MEEMKIIKDQAETVYIRHPKADYAIFCYNTKGDLFLNCDWGFYGFARRAFGDQGFKEFLKKCNADYITGKFATNYNQNAGPKSFFGGRREENVRALVEAFLKVIQAEVVPVVEKEATTQNIHYTIL